MNSGTGFFTTKWISTNTLSKHYSYIWWSYIFPLYPLFRAATFTVDEVLNYSYLFPHPHVGSCPSLVGPRVVQGHFHEFCFSMDCVENSTRSIQYTIQSSSVIMRSNITWYCIHLWSDWIRIWIRIWIHKRHPVPRRDGRVMGVFYHCICYGRFLDLNETVFAQGHWW